MDPGLLAELRPYAQTVAGTTLIGYTIATALYGISIWQVYFYYHNYTDDAMGYKIFIGILWTVDTLTTVFAGHALYYDVVININNIPSDLHIVWSLVGEYAISCVITMMAQSFYAFQIFRITRSALLASIIGFLGISALGVDIWVIIQLCEDNSVTVITKSDVIIPVSVAQGICALCDIVITVTLIFSLRSKKTGIYATESLIDKLIIYAITRGTSTAVLQVMFVILLAIYKDTTYWIPFHLIVTKFYVNSVLSTLNMRKSMREHKASGAQEISMEVPTSRSRNIRSLNQFNEKKYTGISSNSSVDRDGDNSVLQPVLPVLVTMTKSIYMDTEV